MKWLFIGAVLLNIAYFSYNTFFAGEATAKKSASENIGKNHIVLLSELDADQLKKLQEKVVVPPQETEQTQTPSPAPVETEVTQTEQQSDTGTPAPVTNRTNYVCYKLGPFTKKTMDEIKLSLEKEYKNKLSFGIETTSTTTYYRIYIPPLESKDKIETTLAILDKNGMTDHYVMSINGRKKAIALGVFKKRSAAEKIAIKANKAGFGTTIEAISDDKNSQYKLQIVFQGNQDMKFYQDLLEKKKLTAIECEK